MISLQSLKNIIFDQDGVLIESEHLHAESKKITLEHHGIHLPHYSFDKYTGRTDNAFWDEIRTEYPQLSIDNVSLNHHKKDIYTQMMSELRAIHGAVEFIDWARAQGKTLGVVTSSDTFYQTIAFKFLEISEKIDYVVNADAVLKHKPDPEPYLKMKEILGGDSSQSIVIEDSPSGIQAAKGAGLFVVGLTTSFEAERLKLAGADLIVANYEELKKHLA